MYLSGICVSILHSAIINETLFTTKAMSILFQGYIKGVFENYN
jgi:hypothetical protein